MNFFNEEGWGITVGGFWQNATKGMQMNKNNVSKRMGLSVFMTFEFSAN